MKERPIIFNSEMVRAILDGRKTQTRRVMKPQPTDRPRRWQRAWISKGFHNEEERWSFSEFDENLRLCPYGQFGSQLWVREAWADLKGMGFDDSCAYRANTTPGSDGDDARIAYGVKWKPSIHMPRRASRINLEITGVRVERVQEIKESDAKAEGAIAQGIEGRPWCAGPYRSGFADLWDSINDKRGFGWDENPWVWVIEFKTIKP